MTDVGKPGDANSEPPVPAPDNLAGGPSPQTTRTSGRGHQEASWRPLRDAVVLVCAMVGLVAALLTIRNPNLGVGWKWTLLILYSVVLIAALYLGWQSTERRHKLVALIAGVASTLAIVICVLAIVGVHVVVGPSSMMQSPTPGGSPARSPDGGLTEISPPPSNPSPFGTPGFLFQTNPAASPTAVELTVEGTAQPSTFLARWKILINPVPGYTRFLLSIVHGVDTRNPHDDYYVKNELNIAGSTGVLPIPLDGTATGSSRTIIVVSVDANCAQRIRGQLRHPDIPHSESPCEGNETYTYDSAGVLITTE